MGGSFGRKGKEERGPGAGPRFRPDPSAMPFHDYPANCQTQTWTRGLLAMQPHEWLEDAFQIPCFHSWAVVPNGKEPLARPSFNGDLNLRRVWAPMSKRVMQQVREDLHQPVRVSGDARQLLVRYAGIVGAEFLVQHGQDSAKEHVHGRGLEQLLPDLKCDRITRDAVREPIDFLCAVDDQAKAFFKAGHLRRLAALQKQIRRHPDGAKSRPYIVGGAEKELAGLMLVRSCLRCAGQHNQSIALAVEQFPHRGPAGQCCTLRIAGHRAAYLRLRARTHRAEGIWTLVAGKSDFGGQLVLESAPVMIDERQGNMTVSRRFVYEGAAGEAFLYKDMTDSPSTTAIHAGEGLKSKA